jgi:hypothetical protein
MVAKRALAGMPAAGARPAQAGEITLVGLYRNTVTYRFGVVRRRK